MQPGSRHWCCLGTLHAISLQAEYAANSLMVLTAMWLCRSVRSYAHSKALVLQNVATISAGNDRVIGDMIAEALDKVQSDGQNLIGCWNLTDCCSLLLLTPCTCGR